MEQYADQSAYVTLKDHKENFKTKLPCRLINPAKSETGIVSKVELEKINRAIANQIECNQWLASYPSSNRLVQIDTKQNKSTVYEI